MGCWAARRGGRPLQLRTACLLLPSADGCLPAARVLAHADCRPRSLQLVSLHGVALLLEAAGDLLESGYATGVLGGGGAGGPLGPGPQACHAAT